VNTSLSLRQESFNGGDITSTIWSVAGKWDVTDAIFVRGSYGTNFLRAEAALDAIPGERDVTLVTDSALAGANNRFGGGFQYVRNITTAPAITTEEDVTWNAGVGFQDELLGGRLSATVDYSEIEITGEVVTTSAITVLNNVFHTDSSGPNPETDTTRVGTVNFRADCSANLVPFITFGASGCVQGTTTGADIVSVESFLLNGPGFLTRYVDYSINYTHPLLGGDVSFQTDISQYTVYEEVGFAVNGVPFSAGGDRLGFRNNTAGRNGSASQELRGNASIRWSNDNHNFGFRANYQDGYEPDPNTGYTPIINLAGTANDVFSPYGVGKKSYVDYDFTYLYTAPFLQDLELRFGVLNLTDRNPVPDQDTNGYLREMGNPRGRRIEIGLTKRF
jgi:hypothetical protein